MPTARLPLSLQNLLLLDAATCAAMGALLVLAPGTLGELLRIPQPLLSGAGLSLFPIALLIALVGRQRPPRPTAVSAIVAGNALWVAGSLALLFGLIAPNRLGVAFILVQALVVAGFAWLEHAALQASRRLVAKAG